jgi:hypothetical protein
MPAKDGARLTLGLRAARAGTHARHDERGGS